MILSNEEIRQALRSGQIAITPRIGLVVHLTAPTIHAGFEGFITLEMVNHGPFFLRLVPDKTRICQLIFERLGEAPSGSIATDFQGQADPSGRSGP